MKKIASDNARRLRAQSQNKFFLSAAAGVIPITAGGAVANVGATAGIPLALGVGSNIPQCSLASGLLLITSASAAALSGLAVYDRDSCGHTDRRTGPMLQV